MAAFSEFESGLKVGYPIGRVPPEQTVAAGRHDSGVHLFESIGQTVGLTPRVPDQTERAARPQHGGRFGGGDREVEPVPCLRRGHAVEGATSRVPGFEGRDLNVDPMTASDLRHSGSEFHPQHLGATLGNLSGSNPGATTDVENLQSRRHGTEQVVDHRIGIGRPEPVICLGLLVEQVRTLQGQRARCQTVAFAGIHRPQPAPDHWDRHRVLVMSDPFTIGSGPALSMLTG